jgi:nicotine blue oxidoreductase
VDNPAWAAGQSTSLRVGLVALASDPTDRAPDAVLVSVVDQPGMTAAVVSRLVTAWRRTGATVVQASYDGRSRNPVLLAASVLDEVAASVDGDEGARRWLAERRASPGEDVVLVECGDIGRPDDVDTPADLSTYDDSPDVDIPDPTGHDVLAASGPADRSAR